MFRATLIAAFAVAFLAILVSMTGCDTYGPRKNKRKKPTVAVVTPNTPVPPVVDDSVPPPDAPSGESDGGSEPPDGGSGGGEGEGSCSSLASIPATGPVPEGCLRISGDDIGQLSSYTVGDLTVDVLGWVEKTDKAEDQVGVALQSNVALDFVVKSGLDVFRSTADANVSTDWVNPNGLSGPTASGISNITFCPSTGTLICE